jgi:hypothetical protein
MPKNDLRHRPTLCRPSLSTSPDFQSTPVFHHSQFTVPLATAVSPAALDSSCDSSRAASTLVPPASCSTFKDNTKQSYCEIVFHSLGVSSERMVSPELKAPAKPAGAVLAALFPGRNGASCQDKRGHGLISRLFV